MSDQKTKKINARCLVTTLHTSTSLIPFWSRWEIDGLKDGEWLLDEANDYIAQLESARHDGRGNYAYELKRQRSTIRGDIIYSFLEVAAPDSIQARAGISDGYFHVKISPRVGLE
jgi:hypothetical protein